MESHGRDTAQAQMRHDLHKDQQSKNSGQGTNFLQETGEGVKSMAQGAATMAQGAVHGVSSIAQGAAFGAANIAQGAASAVKNTLGMDTTSTTDSSSHKTSHTN